MRIDAHVTFRKPNHLPGMLWPRLESSRFEGCVAVQSEPDDEEWLLALAAEHSCILALVLLAQTPRDLDRLQRHSKFRAVRSTIAHLPDFFRELERRGLALEISSDPLAVMEAAPDLRIAVPAAVGLASVASPKLYVKVAGSHARETFEVFERFGPERMMFASNWPECLAEGTWKLSLAKFTQALGPRTMDVR